jgi:hypothetical protein
MSDTNEMLKLTLAKWEEKRLLEEAAPELLEALQLIASLTDNDDPDPLSDSRRLFKIEGIASAAINKAKGISNDPT